MYYNNALMQKCESKYSIFGNIYVRISVKASEPNIMLNTITFGHLFNYSAKRDYLPEVCCHTT